MMIAWLARGKLHLWERGKPVREHESEFARQSRDRAVRAVQRNAWKADGFSARFQGRRPSVADPELMVQPALISGLGRGRTNGEVLYTLTSDRVAGLFASKDAAEQRLFHASKLHLDHPAAHPLREVIACSVARTGGVSNIAVLRADGSELLEVTEGDSADDAPSWDPAAPTTLLYQSAGIGRDKEGHYRGLGPAGIHRVDVVKGELSTVREDAGHDLLAPRAGPDGALLFIRRPWQEGKKLPPWRVLLDVLLIPWSLLKAIFAFLSFFAMRYTGKPLVRSGDPEEQKEDITQMLVWGNLLDASKAQRAGEDAPALVPASWKLVRARPGKDDEVLASGVLAFDVAADGTIAYTNGSAIEVIAPGGAREQIHKGGGPITQVALA